MLGKEFVVMGLLIVYVAAVITGPIVTAIIIVDLALVPIGIGLIIDGIFKIRKYKKQTRASY